MRLPGSAKVLEARRQRAMQWLDRGLSLHEVGRRVGASPSSVRRWRDARSEQGDEGLKVRSAPGRPPKLQAADKAKLIKLLLRGAPKHGFTTDVWTTSRIAELICTHFGVRYHNDHVGRLLRALGWSHQKPERRAVERDEEAIARWKKETWPRVKKTPRGWVPGSSSPTNRASS
jgi:transposase